MTNLELTRYNDFLFKQLSLTQKRKIQLLYRGDSLMNLCEKLNVNYQKSDTSIKEILEKLFMVGEKAKRYYIDDNGFDINNCENIVFDKISKYLNDSIKNNNKNIITFFDRNPEFKTYFSSKKNKTNFLEIIENVTTQEKLSIRNYYLVLLHQLAAINYKNKSHFVSTSKDYKIAEKFSKSRNIEEKIILHCWSPRKMEMNIVRKHKLPTYLLRPFHYQREYSLLGGILPHFISGIEFSHINEFYPNTNIFKQDITNEIFYDGLNIYQTNFNDILNLTNYKKSINTNGVEIWEDSTSR